MTDPTLHNCELAYYKLKINELETKNSKLKDDVAFFKNQTRELRNHNKDMIWKIQSFRQMEETWLGDKRKAESYALAMEEQENISWAESQIIIGKLKEELKNKDGQLDAMRTLNDSMEDMLSQTKKELVLTREARGRLEDMNDELRDEIERLKDAMPIPGAAIYATEASRDFYTGKFLEERPKTPENADKLSKRKLRKMRSVLR